MPLQRMTTQNAANLKELGILGRGTPYSAVYSPNGRYLAVAGSRGVWLFSAQALEQEPRLLVGESTCENVAFSPDGKTLAACCTNGLVLVWDVTTGARAARLTDYPNVLWAIAFSPDGQSLAVGGQGDLIWIWDTGDFRVKNVLDYHDHSVSSVKFSPDGKLLGSRGNDAVWLYEVETGKAQNILQEAVGDLAFSPNGKTLAIGGTHLWLHNLRTDDQVIYSIENTRGMAALNFNPEGNLLAIGCFDKTVRLWDIVSRRAHSILHGHTGSVHSVAFSPDGLSLASVGLDGSGHFGFDSTVRIWDVETSHLRVNLPDFTLWAPNIALHPDGKTLAAAYADPWLRIWDIPTQTLQRTLPVHDNDAVRNVAFSPDGQTLAVGTLEVTLWDVPAYRKGKVFKTWRTGASEIGFSADGKWLAATSQRPFVRLWNLRTGETLTIPEKRQRDKYVWKIAFSPHSPYLGLIVTGEDIWIWDLDSNERHSVIRSADIFDKSADTFIYDLAFSPDGKHIAFGGTMDRAVHLCDMTSGEQKTVLGIPDGTANSTVLAIAFNHDGTLAAVSVRHGKEQVMQVRVLDVKTGSEIVTLDGNTWEPTILIFSPDDTLLISSSVDGTIRLHGIPGDQ